MSLPLTRRRLVRVAPSLALLAAGLRAHAGQIDGTAIAPIILRVDGKISRPSNPEGARLSRNDLQGIGWAQFTTKTPWYDNPTTFAGVPMAALMRAVGARGTMLRVHALNDYVSEIPISDFATWGVLLALKRDGRYMPIRDKGPLFVVYPYDRNPILRNELFYARSVWQVDRMTVE